jgi:peroxin-2
MFAFPLLPGPPAFLRPSSLFAPIRSLLSQPTSIDYASIASLPISDSEKALTAAHAGLLASLSLETCPICYLRSASAPVTLASDISLPPISGGLDGSGHGGTSDEENRIFVPAQTDCWGRCRYCYYCIMGELASLRSEDPVTSRGEGEKETTERMITWDCLRCGGRVTRAQRVGSALPMVDEIEKVDET